MDQLFNTVGAAAALSFLLQLLKQSPWFPWITTESEKLNRTLAIVGSGLATLGIHIACSQTDHACTLTWASGMAVLSGLWHWAVQFAVTHGWYKAVNKP